MNGILSVLSKMSTAALETEQEMLTHGRAELAAKERAIVDAIKSYPS